jgi:hypothetical protein
MVILGIAGGCRLDQLAVAVKRCVVKVWCCKPYANTYEGVLDCGFIFFKKNLTTPCRVYRYEGVLKNENRIPFVHNYLVINFLFLFKTLKNNKKHYCSKCLRVTGLCLLGICLALVYFLMFEFLIAMRLLFFSFFGMLAGVVTAQLPIVVQLPDVQLTANRLVRGDGDTYGLGDWACTFRLSIDSCYLRVDGQVVFAEKANDFTTIVGECHELIPLEVLKKNPQYHLRLERNFGSVAGSNIGARGYRWFAGTGVVRRANIQTDTFGNDVGRIGGTVQFHPVRILVFHALAAQSAGAAPPRTLIR